MIFKKESASFNLLNKSKIQPDFALVFHSQGKTERHCVVTRHPISNTHQLERGVMIELNEVLKSVKEKNQVKTTLSLNPDTLLAESDEHLLWYKPAHRGIAWLTTHQNKQINFYYPAIIFHYSKGKLKLYSYEGSERPNADTPLFRCPLPNIYADNKFCQGSAALPQKVTKSNLNEVEATLFDAYFVHFHINPFVKPKSTGDALKYFCKLPNDKPFSVKEHVTPIGSTLGHYISQL